MWEPTLEVTKLGPVEYRFEIAEFALHELTEYIVQDTDPYEQPVLKQTKGSPSLDYTFPGPGQYRVTVNAWRPRPGVPDSPEVGRAGRIIRITEPAPLTGTDDLPPDPISSPDNADTARPIISGDEQDKYLGLGIRIIEWLIGREPSILVAFAVGLLVGGGVTYLVLAGGLV